MQVPTPLERAPEALCDFAGRGDLWLKREDIHELGVFKWRSTLPVIAELVNQGHGAVVTSSTGNHGAAVAWACRHLGARAIVFVPPAANERKLALLEHLGAEVRPAGHDLDEAKDAARAFADEEGLAGGVGAAIGRRAPGAVRVGVVAEEMPVMAASYEAGEVVQAATGTTIADGLAVRVAIPLAVERLRTAVDLMLRVSERSIAEALVACHDAGVFVEPSAATALAGVRDTPDLAGDGPIVLVMTGRNVDPELVDRARLHPDLFAG